MTGMTTTTMMGTTSACAENTFWLTMFGGECWNYLRVRGEYWKPGWTHPRLPELPPRARRILTKFGSQRLSGGTTSACAENTSQSHQQSAPARNYLRVRGEYRLWKTATNITSELPPRARRILFASLFEKFLPGTTSACAENTSGFQWCAPYYWNYLRVRGEYRARRSCTTWAKELPPRARRILFMPAVLRAFGGTTSACAENT